MNKGISEYSHGENLVTQELAADFFSTVMMTPVSKLDADQYSAEDLDGVTESLFGSGNLNFLMLQAGQTNETLGHSGFSGTGVSSDFSFSGNPSASPFTISAPAFATNSLQGQGGVQNLDTDRVGGDGDGTDGVSSVAGTNFNAATVASLGASSLAGTAQNQSLKSGISQNLQDGQDGTEGLKGADAKQPPPATDGHSGANGVNGTPGQNGQNGDGTGDYTFIDVDIDLGDLNLDLGDIINAGDILIDLGDVTNLITTTITSITDIVEIINICDLLNITEIVNNTVNNVTNILTEVLGGGGLTLNLDVLLSEISHLNLDVLLSDTTIATLNQIIDLSDTFTLVEQVTSLQNLITLDLGGALNLWNDAQGPDTDIILNTDLNLAGLDLPSLDLDVPLDPIEAIVGDIDLDLNAALELTDDLTGNLLDGIGLGTDAGGDTDLAVDLGAALPGLDLPDVPLDAVFNPLEDMAGDIDLGGGLGLDLSGGGGETDNNAGDSDMTLGLDLDLIDSDLLGADLDIPLDPIEEITGDIDLDLGLAADVLGDAADGLVDGISGGTGEDTLLGDVGDLLGDTAGDILPGLDGGSSGNDPAPDIQIDFIDGAPGDADLDAFLDPVEEIAGDVDIGIVPGIGLAGDSETGNGAGDSDLALNLDLGLPGTDLPGIDLDIPLDPVEDLTGDIDLDITAALDLLNGDGAGGGLPGALADTGGAVQDIISWPESTLPDPGGLLGGGGGDDGGLGSILPDPVGSVSEGLGGLLGGGDHGGGHHHHGGLFG